MNTSPSSPNPFRRLLFTVGLLGLLPLILAGLMFLGLELQDQDTWLKLMPAADFQEPRRGLKLVVVSPDDLKQPWRNLFETHYAYPDGGRLWLITKETMTLPVDSIPPGYWSEALVVTQDGHLEQFRQAGAGLEFRPLTAEAEAGVFAQLADYLQAGVVIASNDKTWAAMQTRLIELKPVSKVIYFDHLGFQWRSNTGGQYQSAANIFGTNLSALSILRLAALFGIVIAAMVALFVLATGSLLVRLAASLFGIPLAVLLVIWFVLTFGLVAPWLFSILPYGLWILLGGVAGWLLINRLPIDWRADWLPRLLTAHLVEIVIVVVAVAGTLAYYTPHFFTGDLSLGTGDTVRYNLGSMYIYDYGYWPLDKVVAAAGPTSHIATYPPSLSIVLGFLLWALNVAPDKVFFPGPQTGAVWLVYGNLLLGLHLALALAAVLSVYLARFRNGGLWVIALALVVVYIPSAHGEVHAAESLFWPCFAFALLAIWIWMTRRVTVFAYLAYMITLGLLLLKSEGWVVAVFLVLPWALWAWTKHRPGSRPTRRTWLGVIGLGLVIVFPYFLLQYQKVVLQVHEGDFIPVSLAYWLQHLSMYALDIGRTFRVFLGYSGVIWIPMAIFPLTVMLLIGGLLQAAEYSWSRIIVPTGVFAYMLIVPAVYVFSTWGDVWEHIRNSWGRLLVTMVFSAGFFALCQVIEYYNAKQPESSTGPASQPVLHSSE